MEKAKYTDVLKIRDPPRDDWADPVSLHGVAPG